MEVRPFWTPDQFSEIVCIQLGSILIYPSSRVPIIGMLCGNAISGVSVALSYVFKELEYVSNPSSLLQNADIDKSENRDKTETYLAFGASRFEACRPLVVDTLRLALMPVINQMRCAAPSPGLTT